MAESQWVIEVNEADFVRQVLERSRTTPVLVDFWAPWCNPCRTLGPILEKLANEMNGRFLLAKVNSDQNPRLAQTLGVRGIPSVKLVMEGRVVDEFTGALPEAQIRRFLDEAIPSETDRIVQQAEMYLMNGDEPGALKLLKAVLDQDPKHFHAIIAVVQVLLAHGKNDEARSLLMRLEGKDAEAPEVKSLLARMEFAQVDADVDSLRAKAEANPKDLDAWLALGQALVALEQFEEGMDCFLHIVRTERTWQEEAGRKAMIKVFELLGHTDPAVIRYRSKLSSTLFC